MNLHTLGCRRNNLDPWRAVPSALLAAKKNATLSANLDIMINIIFYNFILTFFNLVFDWGDFDVNICINLTPYKTYNNVFNNK